MTTPTTPYPDRVATRLDELHRTAYYLTDSWPDPAIAQADQVVIDHIELWNPTDALRLVDGISSALELHAENSDSACPTCGGPWPCRTYAILASSVGVTRR